MGFLGGFVRGSLAAIVGATAAPHKRKG